jgi:hypothetical protein
MLLFFLRLPWVYWQFLEKRGASNLAEQQALLRPIFKLLKQYEMEEAIKAYKKRVGIEAMFKDCKTGGYNLEGSKASENKFQ